MYADLYAKLKHKKAPAESCGKAGAVLDPVRCEWTKFVKVARTHRIGANALPDARCAAEAGAPRVNTDDDGMFF